jgi:small subunit ribosomal protein S18
MDQQQVSSVSDVEDVVSTAETEQPQAGEEAEAAPQPQSQPRTPASTSTGQPRPQVAPGQPRAVGGGVVAAPTAPARRPGGRYVPRRKVCAFCVDNVQYIDYKDVGRLRRYLSERAKIEPRRKTGTCARHQRALSVAIKRARHMALLPFVGPHSR